jgi:hypothetical protein
MGLIVGFVVLLILYISQITEYKRHKKRYDSLTRGLSGANIEDLFFQLNGDIKSINRDINFLEDTIKSLQARLNFAVQKVGFVRYKAFGNTGSDLSYSIVLLDNYNNGFVLSSIYGRENTVGFGKPIINGKSNVPLSPEEVLAIEKALKGDNEKVFN